LRDVATQTVDIGGQELRYAVLGSAGAARTLLVFNGIGASLETAAPFAGRLELPAAARPAADPALGRGGAGELRAEH
jgi:hypothetical protein